MKFTIETAAFSHALKIASVAMMGGPSLPILGNILIQAADNELSIAATNLELYVIHKLPARVEKEGALTLPYSLLAAFMAKAESSTISIEQVDKTARFVAGDDTAVLETLEAAEFPPPLKQDRAKAVTVDAAEILKPFSMLAHAMGDDPSRYQLLGINLAPTKDGTEFAASNAKRIAVYRGAKLSNEDVIAPDDFVKAVLKIQPAGELQIIIADGAITIISEQVEITAKLIEAKFPNWRPAVPERTDIALSCERKALIQKLQFCSVTTDRQFTGLRLTGKKKQIEISQPGKATSTLPGADLNGQPDLSVLLNPRYLIETLSVMDGGDVRIQCGGDTSPVMIEEGNFTAVINRLFPPA